MIRKIISDIKDKISGRVPRGARRSSEWPAVREAHLKLQPLCQLCGGKTKLQVHHILPFHLHGELELNPQNLITLCEGTFHCHLVFGHLGSFQSFNADIKQDSSSWSEKIRSRPHS